MVLASPTMERNLGRVQLVAAVDAGPVAAVEHPPLVAVTWLDAWFDIELGDLDEARDLYEVRTVGYLVRDGAVVSLAQEVLPDGDGYRAVTHIPRAMMTSLTPLEG